MATIPRSRAHIELELIKHKAAHKGQLPHGRVIYGYSIHRFVFWQIIGYAIVGVTFSMQPVMRWACEKLEGFWRIIVADVFLFVSFVGTVNGRFEESRDCVGLFNRMEFFEGTSKLWPSFTSWGQCD